MLCPLDTSIQQPAMLLILRQALFGNTVKKLGPKILLLKGGCAV